MDDRAININTINGDFCLNKFVYNADSHATHDAEAEVVCTQPCEAEEVIEPQHDEELFHFVHPELDETEAWRIHNAVKRVVRLQGIQMICQYLTQLKNEKKVLLPPNPSATYAELARLGMPNGDGFNETTFRKYYNK